MERAIDYRKYYDDETYLFDVVAPGFQDGGLDPRDFYMLHAWKSNRAKNRHRDRLKNRSGVKDFQEAVAAIAIGLWEAASDKDR